MFDFIIYFEVFIDLIDLLLCLFFRFSVKTCWRRLVIYLTRAYRRFVAARLLPGTAEQKRYFWTVLAILTTMLTILMAQLLFGCKSPKTESAKPAASPMDTTRQRLQRQVQTADSAVIVAKDSTLKTQKPYEDAALDYTLWRDRLGF